MRVHFGLGVAAKINWLEARWPSGLLEKFENVEVDVIHAIKEGTGAPANPNPKKGR